MSVKFGKFPSLSAFLESYKKVHKQAILKPVLVAPPALAAKKLKKLQAAQRDVVEVSALLVKREPDDRNRKGGKHHRLRITVLEILTDDPDVADDLLDAQESEREVFVAVRFGDALGIQEKIKGLTKGASLHLKGEWITKEQARAHGGERMSVLHFTHQPLGFICTEIKCYA